MKNKYTMFLPISIITSLALPADQTGLPLLVCIFKKGKFFSTDDIFSLHFFHLLCCVCVCIYVG